MHSSNQLFGWVEENRDIAFDIVRIYLGIGLFVRGWLFISDTSTLAALTESAGTGAFVSSGIAHYVALAHLGGGLFMALGLITRVAALIQIPALIGAVFFVHLGDGLLAAGQSLEFSALVLFLLIVIFLHGSGRLSLDYLLFEREQVQALREAQREYVLPPQLAYRTEYEEGGGEPLASDEAATVNACTCEVTRERGHPDVRAERRYGMGAIRFLTGTTGTPREIVFRCRVCRNVVETSKAPEDIAYYTYR